MDAVSAVRIRMYRQGLGDCFLLSFGQDSGFVHAEHILIDCGTLGATTTGVKLKTVVEDIAETANKRLSAVVATHEHSDHVSGFKPQFDQIGIDNVWLAWTEDPEDELAKELEKYRTDLKLAALSAAQAMHHAGASGLAVRSLSDATRDVLSFFGDDPLGADFARTTDAAMKYVASRAKGDGPEYLNPGTVLQPAWLPGVTVYVLAPPRSAKAIKAMGKHGDPELYELSGRFVQGFGAVSREFTRGAAKATKPKSSDPAVQEELEQSLPFDAKCRCKLTETDVGLAPYHDKANAWRRIDTDWLSSGAELALQLDDFTNNTSLVLAFEIGVDGPVILMAADAQLGSWLSWHKHTWKVPRPDGTTRIVRAQDLLNRTKVYKVGHHGSHNATAVKHGLEMMTSKDLVALIPIDEKVAQNKGKGWRMPAPKLYEELLKRTHGRVICSDTGLPDQDLRPKSVPKGRWGKMPPSTKLVTDDTYFDVILST